MELTVNQDISYRLFTCYELKTESDFNSVCRVKWPIPRLRLFKGIGDWRVRKATKGAASFRGSDYAHAVQELNKAIDRAGGLLRFAPVCVIP